MISLREYQSDLVGKIRDAFRAGKRSPMVVAPTGSGKCLAKGTPVLMFNGQIKPVEQIKVGDRLMGPDSKPRRVLSLARGREEMFRVTPIKGDPYTVNRSHILSLRLTGNKGLTYCGGVGYNPGDVVNVSVDQYLSANNTFKHCAKGWRVGVNFKSRPIPKELPPYILGAWLGDGTSRGSSWSGIDKEVFQEIKWHALAMGLDTRDEIVAGKCPELHITSRAKTGRGVSKNVVKTALKKLNLIQNKHVPDVYKINDRETILEVLAGLMDTDGSLSRCGYDYISKVEQLADDVCFMARSVGLAAYKKECQKTCTNNGKVGTYYRVSISGETSIIPCRIARKRAAARLQKKDVTNTGIKVESVGEGDYYGFEIDSDRLFLLGDFTVTHNTVLFSYISHGTAAKGNRVLILVHRQELIDQTARTLRAFNVPHGIIAAGRSGDRHQQVQVASVQTIVRRLGIFKPDLIIIDECHHSTSGSWLKVIAANPQARILGFTATPERLDGKSLGAVFDEMILGPQVSWLIENGHLCKPRYFAPPVVADLSRLRMRGGDFAKDELAAVMDSKMIIGDAVDHYRRIIPGEPSIAFCVSLDHARHTSEQFQAAGFRSACIDGTLKPEVRKRMISDLGNGGLHVLASCDLIGEGVDIPVVVGAILQRPTASLALHLQQLGRPLRTAIGKQFAVILDHVGNLGRHGYAETEREWSLEGRAKGKRTKQESSVEMRQCPSCYLCHEPAPVCPECGHVYEIQRRELETVAGELVEIDPEIERRERKKEQGACQTMDDLIALGRKRGMRNPAGWARYVWQARQARRSA